MKSRHLLILLTIVLVLPSLAAGQTYPNAPQLELRPDSGGALGAHDCTTNADNPFANCSFESGDLTGWVVNDYAAPFLPAQVAPAGSYLGFGFFTTAPTQGTSSAVHGFDAGSLDTLEIAQDVSLPAGDIVTLAFDYRGAWELSTFGATIDRTFQVQVQPTGGGAALSSEILLTATAGTTVLDTGILEGSVDLSAYAGQDVRVAMVWDAPEANTGPGFFEVDNVDVTAEFVTPLVDVPTQSTIGLTILITALLGAAIFTIRRRG